MADGAFLITCDVSIVVNLFSGRLGLGQHTQYQLCPLAQFQQNIASLALGQDHTLALTRSGEVYSWGLNRFSQLGYVVEAATGTSGGPGTGAVKTEEAIQSIPKRILGSLRKETVLGVAACKTASACWTDRELFTWGTNAGQLGALFINICLRTPSLRGILTQDTIGQLSLSRHSPEL